ncbi:MAG: RNA polymerase sigma factor [Myxococcales bacterium]|nr:RNA polymerase sigma factor [Myxococcales bacterium]
METRDFELLAAWRAGDTRAGETLFARHFAAIHRFFRNKVADDGDFEDLVQSTFMTCVERSDSFEGRSSFRTYLFGIAHNRLRNYYRSKRRHDARFDPGTVSAVDLGAGPATAAVQHSEQRLLLTALRRLPLDLQIALEMHYWEQLTAADIAEALEIPAGTAKSRLRRAKQLLRERLQELASTPAVLTRTLQDLDGWARGLRDELS